jgi:uncharacterized coiled-coil DUF342 family protein
MNWNYHWRTHPGVNKLEQTIDQLHMDNIGLRHELQTNRAQLGSLKLALHQRLETIDELRATIDQLRATNQRLDAEADHLAELVRQS